MTAKAKTKAPAKKKAPAKEQPVEADMNGKLDAIFEKYPKDESSLIMVLQDVQDTINWLSPEAMDRVAEELNVPRARVQSVATFYRSFSLEPRGKKLIKVCMGTACHVRGAPILVDELERKLGVKAGGAPTCDNHFSLETVNCVGACALAPAIVVGEEYYSKQTPSTLDKLLKKERES